MTRDIRIELNATVRERKDRNSKFGRIIKKMLQGIRAEYRKNAELKFSIPGLDIGFFIRCGSLVLYAMRWSVSSSISDFKAAS